MGVRFPPRAQMKIKILFEDSNILVIDKPSGISVHRDGRKKEETISDWFVSKYPESKNVGESIFSNEKEIEKPGIVHRLDRETSGVLLLVKNQEAFLYYKNLFKNREIKKIYIALVEGIIKKEKGIIDKPIGRSPSDFRRRLAGRGARGEMRDAVTEYKVLKQNKKEKFSMLEICPKTGRTHQIRVHMKYNSSPVLCDKLYNPNGLCPSILGRLALHAKSLEFENQKGEKIKIESKISEEFEKTLA